jgi:hypothetical protein
LVGVTKQCALLVASARCSQGRKIRGRKVLRRNDMRTKEEIENNGAGTDFVGEKQGFERINKIFHNKLIEWK